MPKTILVTGATDGIGLETAKRLAQDGHFVLLHGRSADKLDAARAAIGGNTQGYLADLSQTADLLKLSDDITRDHAHLDVLINNAGVLKATQTVTVDGRDLRLWSTRLRPTC